MRQGIGIGVFWVIFVATSLTLCARTNAQLAGPIFERVYSLRVNVGTPSEIQGTAFAIDIDGRQYLITAKHMVAGMGDTGKISLTEKGDYTVKIFRCEDPIDIAVLVAPLPLTFEQTMKVASNGPDLGGDFWFMGFPLGIELPAPKGKGGFINPPALVKHADFSGIEEITERIHRIYLDGYNNHGFSGGPVLVKTPNNEFQVYGVISGFRPEYVFATKVVHIDSPQQASMKAKAEEWRIVKKADGSWAELVDIEDEIVPLNTGIAIAYEIYPALEVIRAHPIGPALNDPKFR